MPEGHHIRLPLLMSGGITFDCIYWKVFSSGVDKVVECLETDICELQAMIIA